MSQDKGPDSNSRGSGCPATKDVYNNGTSPSSRGGWSSWFGWAAETKGESPSNSASAERHTKSKLPVASVEEAAAYSQRPHPDQGGVPLSRHRMISSIPRGVTDDTNEPGPRHQPKLTQNACPATASSNEAAHVSSSQEQPSHWIYPSEQQFFHALRKKGWDHVEAQAIPSVLEIHNTINERTWKQVQDWEADMGSTVVIDNNSSDGYYQPVQLKLVRFQGRPNDLSPQALIWTKLFWWNEPPFDRHDWYVQAQPATSASSTAMTTTVYPIRRYVIDYYMLPPPHPELPPIPYVDARPALDSPRAFCTRVLRLLQDELPSLTSEWQAWRVRSNAGRYYDGATPAAAGATAHQCNRP